MTTAADATPYVRALRASHDRLAGVVAGFGPGDLRAQSYDTEWTVADVLSHLGSGAEIFGRFVEAGVTGGDPPGADDFKPVWDEWNARSPQEQASRFVTADQALVTRLESLTPEQRAAFSVTMFGRTPLDLAGVLGLRLAEHAVHSWDVEVVRDPAARVAPGAVGLLIDSLPALAGFTARKAPAPVVVAITVTGPERAFSLDTGGVTLVHGNGAAPATATAALPAEAFLRLVYGRLDDPAELTASGVTLSELKAVFPGF